MSVDTLREAIAHENEPGVVIDGTFRRLPRLDLTHPDEGERE
jgi:hypothetical protein